MAFLGQQYTLPQQQYGQPQSPAMEGPQNKQQAYQEGLLGLEEDVKGYYKDWNAINQFAHGMWQNYGIDVTAPDPMNPASVDAYNMYLQGLAQIQERGNTMKNRQELFKMGFQESLRNADVRFSEGVQAETFDPTKDIANIGPTSVTKMVMQRYGRPVKSQEELAELQQYQQEAIQILEQEYQEAEGDPRLQLEIQKQIDAVKSVKPSYDPTFDKQLELQEKVAWIRRNEKTDKSYVSARYQEIANIRGGNLGTFKTMLDKNGNPTFKDVSFSPADGKIYLRPSGDVEAIEIDLNSADGGAKAIHDVLNRYTSMDDEQVDWNEVLGFGTKYKKELGDSSILTKLPKYDETGVKIANKALSDPKNAMHKPLMNALNTLAGQNLLVLPNVDGLYGLKIDDIDFDWKLFEVGTGFSSKIRISYIDNDGEKAVKVIDQSSPQDKAFLDKFLKVNSGVIDFTQLGQAEKAATTVQMKAPDGTMYNVPEGDVEAALAEGYTKQ